MFKQHIPGFIVATVLWLFCFYGFGKDMQEANGQEAKWDVPGAILFMLIGALVALIAVILWLG